jgi:DNA repair exonuclease SbcCD nuclease subunit
MSLTILAIGDVHVQTSNIPEIELFIQKITDLATTKKPDIIVILGDILHYHERLHTTCLNKACDFIDKMRKITCTYILVGNHDYENNQQFLTDNHWMNSLKYWDNLTVVDRVVQYKKSDIQLTLVPYVPPGRFEEALNTTGKDWKNSDIIFAHQEFIGFKMGSITSSDGDKWSLDYPHVISGHIHLSQTNKNIYYTGSSIQDSFDGSDKNTVAYLSVNDKHNKKSLPPYILEEIDLKLPRRKIVNIDADCMEKYDEENIDSKDKIKISVTGSYEEFKALKKTSKYKDLTKKGVKVVFKPKNIYVCDTDTSVQDTSVQNTTTFSSILNDIINQQKNSHLYKAYEFVVNNKHVGADEILYV